MPQEESRRQFASAKLILVARVCFSDYANNDDARHRDRDRNDNEIGFSHGRFLVGPLLREVAGHRL
jgi:hypothetical protein